MGLDWVPSKGIMYLANEIPGEVYEVQPDGSANLLAALGVQLSGSADANGVCYVEGSREGLLYIANYNGQDGTQDPIYVLNEVGTVLDSLDVHAICPGIVGIAFDGTDFWLSSYTDGTIVKCNQAFELLQTFPHPAGSLAAGAIDFDADTWHLYISDMASSMIYVCDLSMNVIDVFPGSWLSFGCLGVTIGRYTRGRTIWTSNFNAGKVWELEDSYYAPVECESWSGIKALFR